MSPQESQGIIEQNRLKVDELNATGLLFLQTQVEKGEHLQLIPQMEALDWPWIDAEGKALRLDSVRIDWLHKIVYDKNEDNLLKFTSLYSAAYAAGCAVFILVRSDEKKTELYLGINGGSQESTPQSMATLEAALQGNFPGIRSESIDQGVVRKIHQELQEKSCISCVTGIPSRKNSEDIPFAQGLEKIMDAMGNRPYSALLLATPVQREQLREAELAYQDLYSQLSLYNRNQMTVTGQQSVALGETLGSSFTDSFSKNLSRTNTTTHTDSKSQTLSNAKTFTVNHSETVNESQTHTDSKTEKAYGGGGGASTGAVAVGLAGASIGTAIAPGLGTAIGGGIGLVVGAIGGLVFGGSKTTSDATTEGKSTTDGTSSGETNTKANTTGTSDSLSVAISTGNTIGVTAGTTEQSSKTRTELQGISYNFAVVAKRIVEAQKSIDEQLERMRQSKNYGAWNWSAYFLANSNEDTSIGANVLSGILRGEQSGVEQSAILHWNKSDRNFPAVSKALSVFRHPVFRTLDGQQMFSPTALLSTPELAIGMSLPQKSLPGLPVFESAEFGRSVISRQEPNGTERPFHFGHIVHLDKEYLAEPVDLDLDSLTSHVFITGATGSGKSTAIYSLLGKLKKEKIPFLVIEPAKGEYKNVFGGLRGIKDHVYGTNPYQSKLLRINPFSFPEGIHIIEHIDRLIEILNAAWPMYSAMPAILKQAVEKCYEKYGWDLLTSRNKFETRVFPDFTDLMDILPKVIDKTDYSAEVLGNYKGALVERVRSLTNGYYRSIFQKDELRPNDLFDCSAIVDLSRVGSGESKALLMGIIFLKLQEYRMTEAIGANSPLRHVTVLEEAHHLLRQTSTAQDNESANLAGKSIEMLTNAIAEMRTFGEGFVIADQAPGLLDPAVIRNTNTKIAFNLPDAADRELVGKAQGLNDAQIDELAHLHRGQAVVRQNNWLEAVICAVDNFTPENLTNMKELGKYTFNAPTPDELKSTVNDRRTANTLGIQLILDRLYSNKEKPTKEQMQLLQLYYPEVAEMLQQDNVPFHSFLHSLGNILLDTLIGKAPKSRNMNNWLNGLLYLVFHDERIQPLASRHKEQLLKAILQYLVLIEKDCEAKNVWQKASEKYQSHLWRIEL